MAGFDWSLLNGHRVIGINKSFLYYPAKVNFAMDYRFFDMAQFSADPSQKGKELHEAWMRYQGIKVFVRHDYKYRFAEGIYYVDALNQKAISYDLDKG
ncbi:MAG: hypothetical protein ACTSPB_23030, partial [Candidatus Thorarchaeota archaeon]